jgi:3-oxoacyl-[acyl-carrier-protein] synthase II
MSRFIQLAVSAAREAIEHSGLRIESEEHSQRCGVSIGTGIGSLEDTIAAHELLKTTPRKLSPHYIPRMLGSLAAGRVSMREHLAGPVLTPASACAAAAHAIGEAYNLIRLDYADVMLAGGTEACVNALAITGFGRLRALRTGCDARPVEASRPFDRERGGFVLAEGAGALVLESLEHALSRGASIMCELKGYGLSGDAHHATAPHPQGRGALHAMRMALKDAHLNPSQLDYVNSHATSTPLGDAVEALAIATLLQEGDTKGRCLVSSTKGATGHLLGAAGAVEALFAILSIRDGMIPHTLNLQDPDPNCVFGAFEHVAQEHQRHEVRTALSNSFGFGGTNASLVFTKYDGL